MSLSHTARRNIAFAAAHNFVSDTLKVSELATQIAQKIIEEEIGFASEDIEQELFTELIGVLYDSVFTKITEICRDHR